MIVKKHVNTGRLVLAICDDNLLGHEFIENDLILDLKSSFYQGKKCSKEELSKLITQSYMINAIGKESISFLIKNNMTSLNSIKKIDDIPYVLIVLD